MMHSFYVRVYYEDTDAGGIVFYANYLKFAERARTELLREAGIAQSSLLQQTGEAFVVSECRIKFHRPAVLDDMLNVETQVVELGKVRVRLEQRIKRGDETLVTLDIALAFINQLRKPVAIPARLREVLQPITPK